jgi:hypothetical protein
MVRYAAALGLPPIAWCCMVRIGAIVTILAFSSATAAAPPDFDKQIAPILATRCLDCHSGAKPKGKFDISRKANVQPDELWKRVAAGEMPPKKPLPEAELKLLKEWIETGAKWGTDPIDPFRFTTSTRAGYDWWALQPVKRPELPKLSPQYSAFSNPIDKFVLKRLEDAKLPPSRPADRRTLIRRLYFDLTGLPPSPEEVEAFVNDKAPDAYVKLVDRLLASPHYGERWARHWLDVVRYGETDGFERNTPRPNAWHYRDWVIRALNADMPYDEFVRLQLAGDVLKPNDPDAVRATGFLVAAVHNTVLGNELMVAIARQDELEDLVGSVGQTFLGLTTNCARCHDHKFDPISQTEFYRLAAALGGVNHGERLLPDVKVSAEIAKLTKQRENVTRDLALLEDPARQAALKQKVKKLPAVAVPAPVAAWDFRKSGYDLIGKLDVQLVGEVKLTSDGAVLDGKTTFLRTPPLPFALKTKTLEAWVKLDSLTQRGGGVISVQTPDGNEFDAIVFGEREPGRWMAGSNGFVRTSSFGGQEERDAVKGEVHVAITYSTDGTITGYRDGKPYGKAYASKGLLSFATNKAVVVIGCRHEPAGGNKMLAGTVSVARVYDTALSAAQIEASFAGGATFVTDSEIDAELTAEQRTTRASLRAELAKLAAELEKLEQRVAKVKAYANIALDPGITRFLTRGDITQPGAVVTPAGLAAVTGPKANFGLAPNASDTVRRKKLAEWVTAPNNPLFARVIVNRVWHYHFGTGIVDTPSDFGFNGGRPSHPELLDWLAAEFAEKKYSLKALHKLIVTSATYQQASTPRKEAIAADADNRSLWRFKPHRLEGEVVRDTMLAVSGLLNREIGGKGFSDYKVRDFNGTAYFDPFDPVGAQFHRRSIYRFTPRGANQGLLDAFDCPDPAAAAPRRAITTTPLQALSLWNNGFALRMSDAFAARVAKEADSVEKQVTRAWQYAYQRDPTLEEAKLAAKLVSEHGLKALCRALFNSNEFVTVE